MGYRQSFAIRCRHEFGPGPIRVRQWVTGQEGVWGIGGLGPSRSLVSSKKQVQNTKRQVSPFRSRTRLVSIATKSKFRTRAQSAPSSEHVHKAPKFVGYRQSFAIRCSPPMFGFSLLKSKVKGAKLVGYRQSFAQEFAAARVVRGWLFPGLFRSQADG